MAAAWPLYTFSRRELAPVEDQSHISLFMEASPGRLAGGGQPRLARGRQARSRRSPRPSSCGRSPRHWGGFGGMVAKDWKERDALDRGDVRRGVRRRLAGAGAAGVPAARSAAARRRASTTSSWCCRATRRPSRCSRRSAPVVGAGWQSGKFLYVDTDLKIDLPEARVVIDREQVADLGLDLASVGQELGTLLGGGVREPVQLLRPQLQGHPADRRGGPGDGRPAARPQDQDAERRAGAGLDVHAHRDRAPRRAR